MALMFIITLLTNGLSAIHTFGEGELHDGDVGKGLLQVVGKSKGDGELVKSVWELQLSDVCLYSIYALVVVSII